MSNETQKLQSKLPQLVFFTRSVTQPSMIKTLHQSLSATQEIKYEVTSVISELTSKIESSERMVLLANCLLNEDITDLYNVFPEWEAYVKKGTLRILVLNSIHHPRLGSLLKSRCAVTILEHPVSLKAIQHRIKYSLASVHHAWNRIHSPKENREVTWQSSSDFQTDFWWLPSPKLVKRIKGNWIVSLLGPSPVAGVWEEIPGAGSSEEKKWAWCPSGTADEVFQTRGGRWVFRGNQPKFSWQTGFWTFASKRPSLAYYEGQNLEPAYVRFEAQDSNGLSVRENSTHVQGLLPRIEETFESHFSLGGTNSNSAEDVLGSWSVSVEDEASFDEGSGAEDPASRGTLEGTASPEKSKVQRNALTPDEGIRKRVGLGPVLNAGVEAGKNAFDRIQFFAEALQKNGEYIPTVKDLVIYDLTGKGAVLLAPESFGKIGDRFHLRIRFDTGQLKLECTMVWEFSNVELSLGDRRLVSGVFRSGDFDPLFSLLDHFEKRKGELKDFFTTAKG